jgi:2-oxoglutarate ferredoxin oxidoreductase subunit alpha
VSKKIRLLSGNEVVAESAIVAGCRFYAGYPITPSSEIAAVMAKELPKVGGRFIQMEDEIASMGAIIGASLAGVKSLTATSGPGFSLKQEHIGFACMTEIPCVIVNVMRGGPSTGLPTAPSQSDVMQAMWGTHGDHPVIALCPSYLREIFMETVRAFNLSEKYRTPVILLLDEITGHMNGRFESPDIEDLEIIDRKRPTVPPDRYYPYDTSFGDVPPLANFFEGYRFHVTGLNHDKTGFPTIDPEVIEADEERLLKKISNNLDDIIRYERMNLDDAEIALVAYGSIARSARAAMEEARAKGIKVGLFRPITLWPFPEKALLKVAEKVHTIIVSEMNLGQMILEVERVIKERAKLTGVHQVDSRPISPERILKKIEEVIK